VSEPDVFIALAKKIIDEHLDGIVLGVTFDARLVKMIQNSPDFRDASPAVQDCLRRNLVEAFAALRVQQDGQWTN
jgi:hypothetical protein